MKIELEEKELKKLMEIFFVGLNIMNESFSEREYNFFLNLETKILDAAKKAEIDFSRIAKYDEEHQEYEYNKKFKENMFKKYIINAYDKGVNSVATRLVMNEIERMDHIEDLDEIELEQLIGELYEKYLDEIYENECMNLVYEEPVKVKKAMRKKHLNRKIVRKDNILHVFGNEEENE